MQVDGLKSLGDVADGALKSSQLQMKQAGSGDNGAQQRNVPRREG